MKVLIYSLLFKILSIEMMIPTLANITKDFILFISHLFIILL